MNLSFRLLIVGLLSVGVVAPASAAELTSRPDSTSTGAEQTLPQLKDALSESSQVVPRQLAAAVSVDASRAKTSAIDLTTLDLRSLDIGKAANSESKPPKSGSVEKNGNKSRIQQTSATAKPTPPKPLKRRVLVFKASWCGACQLLNYEWPKLRDVRWRIGSKDSDHFQLVDADYSPELMSRYGIASLPTLVLIEDGREISRQSSLSAKDMAEFYYGRLK